MVMRRYFILLFILSTLTNLATAQEDVTRVIGVGTVKPEPTETEDTIPAMDIDDPELDNVVSLREQFEKQNKMYSVPAVPNENLLRFLNKDEIELSEEALYWVNLVRDPATIRHSTPSWSVWTRYATRRPPTTVCSLSR